MDKEDARKQTLVQLHERRKQVVRLHKRGMSLLKTAVFLAPRFEEFAELRRQLKELIANYPAPSPTRSSIA